MADYKYLIVGGGLSGDGACRGIREHDPDGSIGLFAEEQHEPYARPPLTKSLWKGKDENTIWKETTKLGVDLHTGTKIASLDLDAHTATDDTGETHSYRTGAARDGRDAAAPAVGSRRRHLLPHGRPLPPSPCART